MISCDFTAAQEPPGQLVVSFHSRPHAFGRGFSTSGSQIMFLLCPPSLLNSSVYHQTTQCLPGVTGFWSSLERVSSEYYGNLENELLGSYTVFLNSVDLWMTSLLLPSLPMLLSLSCGKFLFLSWLGLPRSFAFKVQSQEFRSLAMENESQVCGASCLGEMDLWKKLLCRNLAGGFWCSQRG